MPCSTVQGDCIGFNTGNGGKLNSQAEPARSLACCLVSLHLRCGTLCSTVQGDKAPCRPMFGDWFLASSFGLVGRITAAIQPRPAPSSIIRQQLLEKQSPNVGPRHEVLCHPVHPGWPDESQSDATPTIRASVVVFGNDRQRPNSPDWLVLCRFQTRKKADRLEG